MALERRLKIAADLAAIPDKFKLPIAVGVVNRVTWAQEFPVPEGLSLKNKEAICHASGFIRCAVLVDQWMRENANDEVCLMIVEDNPNSRMQIRAAQSFFQSRAKMPKGTGRVFPLRRIKQDPLFEPKSPASLLQVADFCAYVSKRVFMNSADERYRPFWDAFVKQLVWPREVRERLS